MKINGIEVVQGEYVVPASEFFGQHFVAHGVGRGALQHRLHATNHQLDLIVASQFFALEVWSPTGTKIVPARLACSGYLEAIQIPTPRFVRGACGWGWCRLSELAEFVGAENQCLLTMNRSTLRVVVGDTPEGELVLLPPDFKLDTKNYLVDRTPIDPTKVWVPAGWAKQICILALFTK